MSGSPFEELCDKVVPQVQEYYQKIAVLNTEHAILNMLTRVQQQHQRLWSKVDDLRNELHVSDNNLPFEEKRDRYCPVIKHLLDLVERTKGREQKKEVTDTIMTLIETQPGLLDLTPRFRKTVKDKCIELIQKHHLASAVRVYEKHFVKTRTDKEDLQAMIAKPPTDFDLSEQAIAAAEEKKKAAAAEEEKKRTAAAEEENKKKAEQKDAVILIISLPEEKKKEEREEIKTEEKKEISEAKNEEKQESSEAEVEEKKKSSDAEETNETNCKTEAEEEKEDSELVVLETENKL
jgi:hypothetical protein